jgi:hypothetical protein
MFIALLLLSPALLNTKPSPVFANVSIGESGPYRFLVDTGSQISLIDPKLADKLKLKAEFRVPIVTQNTTRLLPGRKMNTLRIGQHALSEVEVVWHDLDEACRFDASVMGVLGIERSDKLRFRALAARWKI